MEKPRVNAASPPCTGPAYDLAKSFVGTWQEFTVTEEREVLVGNLTSAFDLDGCMFTQRFLSADASFSFMSFGYVDQGSSQWLEHYVFNNGKHASYRWRSEGEDIITERIGGNPEDLRRLRIRFLSVDLYEVMEQSSIDGGKIWKRCGAEPSAAHVWMSKAT